jgi:hypothetical protein
VSLLVAAAALTAAVAPMRFKAGPPPGVTGGFGEPTCRKCHFDNELNDLGGRTSLVGLPAEPGYRPGDSYELSVVLRRAGMLRAGFQIAARVATGPDSGAPAGVLTPIDQRTAVVWDTTRHLGYLEHTAAGTTVNGDSARWRFRWTAPPGSKATMVVFHWAANAANDDDSPLGDFIHTGAVRVRMRPR